MPSSTWHRGLRLSPAVGGSHAFLLGFRGAGGKAPRAPTQAHLTSLPRLLTPGCPALNVKPGSSGPHTDSYHWPILCRWPTSLPQAEKPSLLLPRNFTQPVLSCLQRPLCSCQAQLRAISSRKGDKGNDGGNDTPKAVAGTGAEPILPRSQCENPNTGHRSTVEPPKLKEGSELWRG